MVSSDLLKTAWAYGVENEEMARESSGLAPRNETELKPAPSLWIPQAIRSLGESIGKLDGWVYDEESRELQHRRETEDYSQPPIMVETFTSLAELVEAVTVMAIFTRGKTLGLSDKQIQEVWNGVANAMERFWQAKLPDQFQLVTESCK